MYTCIITTVNALIIKSKAFTLADILVNYSALYSIALKNFKVLGTYAACIWPFKTSQMLHEKSVFFE